MAVRTSADCPRSAAARCKKVGVSCFAYIHFYVTRKTPARDTTATPPLPAMANFMATNCGISDVVGNSAPTNSGSQREMPLRSAGDSSGVQHNAADNSSTHEEQHNEFVISSVLLASNVANVVGSDTIDWTFAEQNPILSEEDALLVGFILARSSSITEEHNGFSQASPVQPNGNGNGATDSSIPDLYTWNDELRGNFVSAEGEYPPEDMLAASTTSSSTATLGPDSDVDNVPLSGASQQVGTVDAGNTTGLPVLIPGEDCSMRDPSVRDFRRNHMSTLPVGNGTICPRVLMGGANDSADMVAEATLADTLAGGAQSTENIDAGSSIDNNNNFVASPATLDGSGQQKEQMGAGNSVNNFGALHAPLSGYGPPPIQMGAGNSASYPVADQATLNGFYVQPQMPIGAGSSSTTNNFAAQQLPVAPATYNDFQGVQQQLNFAPNGYNLQQMGPNGSVQPVNPQLNTAPQPYGYHGAAQAAPPNGMEQHVQTPIWLAGYDAVNAMAYQQLGGLNSGAQPNMGQNWQATAPQPDMYGMDQQLLLPAFNGHTLPQMWQSVPIVALQFAAPVATARKHHLQEDASVPHRPHHTGPAIPAGVPIGPVPNGPAANPVPAQQQQVAAQHQHQQQEGPYTHTAAGAPNPDSTKKGNKQGQVKGWGQAFRHHKLRCDSFRLNGCFPDCQVRAKWPLTWADWTSRRFRVEWKTAQDGRPQIEDLSGFAVYCEGKERSEARFAVLGEIQADGSMGKAKSLHRLEKAALKGPPSG